MASEIKVNKISPESGTTLTLGDSGDTINFGTGVLPNFENLTVTGDLTVDTNSLKVDSTNNFVGIGTASPSVALDVVGAITATGNITGTLATAAQPNITSVGTLTGLTTGGITSTGDFTFNVANGMNINAKESLNINIDSDDNDSSRVFAVTSGSGGTSETLIQANEDAGVSLYYDNSKKFETSSTGATVTGNFIATGNISTGNNGVLNILDGDGDISGKLANQSSSSHSLEIIADPSNSGANSNMMFKIDNSEKARFDASGNFLVGTTSASGFDSAGLPLIVGSGSTHQGITIFSGTSHQGAIHFADGTGTSSYRGQLNYKHDADAMTFAASGSEKMRITSAGLVGIGTTSPSRALTVSGSVSPVIAIVDTGTSGTPSLFFGDSSADNVGKIQYSNSDNSLSFVVNSSERMRINSSGHVFISKTNNTIADDGHAFTNSFASHTVSNNPPLYLNRKSSDGTIIGFRKDDTTVGGISTRSSDLCIFSSASGHSGLRLGGNVIFATNNSGVENDNIVDFGSPNLKFKDIYLGGGAYIGGTGSANKLDDYEEGTWTPSINSVSGFTNTNVDFDYSTYTKIGNLVNLRTHIQFPDSSGNLSTGDFAYIRSLPFAPSSAQDHTMMNGYRYNNGSNGIGFVTTATTTNELRWVCNYVIGSPLRNGGRVSINFFYRTDS